MGSIGLKENLKGFTSLTDDEKRTLNGGIKGILIVIGVAILFGIGGCATGCQSNRRDGR